MTTADDLFSTDGAPPLGPRESSPLPPPPPLPPASPELRATPDGEPEHPHIDADQLFMPATTVADAPEEFSIEDHGWDLKGRPTLRVRDLLEDPDEPPAKPATSVKDEVSFFAPVTPEQLGADPDAPVR